MSDIERPFVAQLLGRLQEEAPLLQVVVGARQVGKTTGIKQLIAQWPGPTRYASADDLLAPSAPWLRENWQEGRRLGPGALLVVDEIQKVPNWSETIKALWDRTEPQGSLRCALLGSSSLSIQRGLTESLAGRFELLAVPHWSYAESKQAFGHDLPTYLTFGGYPGAERFRGDYDRWFGYLKKSVVDTAIGQDILSQQTVTKPALFRQAFEILCGYPGCEVSYTTLLGQLQDRGNTDLVKHYLELYEGAFLFKALSKLSTKVKLTKSSSPKILVACPALVTLAHGPGAIENPEHRGHVFESAVGMDLVHTFDQVYYWRAGQYEVDYAVRYRGRLLGVEVKSGRKRRRSGIEAFRQTFDGAAAVIVSPDNYEGFCQDPREFTVHYCT